MTTEQSNELDKILASIKELRISQKETSEQMKETDRFLSKKFAETDEQQKKTDEQMKRTDEQMKRTDEKLERMGIHLGGISNNNGEMAEEFFYRSLQEKLSIHNVQYDDIGRNWFKNRHGIKEEYDIILTNGKALEIVEVKYKVHEKDLEKLERKRNNFKKLFPVYSDFTVHASIAGMTIPEDVILAAKEKGFHALIAKGEHMEEVA